MTGLWKWTSASIVLLSVLAGPGDATQLTPFQTGQYAYGAGFRGDGLVMAIAIAGAESGYRTDALGPNYDDDGNIWSWDRGLWQINDYWHAEVTDACAYDAACCATETYRISSHGANWNQWATYTGGVYKNYLDQARAAAAAIEGGPDIWVQFGFGGTQYGTESNPFNNLPAAMNAVPNGGTVHIKAGTGGGITTLDPGGKTVTLKPEGGSVTLAP